MADNLLLATSRHCVDLFLLPRHPIQSEWNERLHGCYPAMHSMITISLFGPFVGLELYFHNLGTLKNYDIELAKRSVPS
eukprot:scaffold501614_cov14-Prasinocladus_malaysianus.AAC.1